MNTTQNKENRKHAYNPQNNCNFLKDKDYQRPSEV